MCMCMGKLSVYMYIEAERTTGKIFLVLKLVLVFSHHDFTPAVCREQPNPEEWSDR